MGGRERLFGGDQLEAEVEVLSPVWEENVPLWPGDRAMDTVAQLGCVQWKSGGLRQGRNY